MKSLTYEAAGVPPLKGDPAFKRQIRKLTQSTRIPGVLGSSTGFASLFDFKKAGIRDPLLVSSTDGVGTKLDVARLQGRHDTIGIDLVAMCVNDLITCGAKPVFFLDYFATGKFDGRLTREVLKGIATGCRQAGCALVGGETAVMPGFYASGTNHTGYYDLAGFSVGLVDRRKVITGEKIRPGDILLGLASSGVHSNGFSLIRKIFSQKELRGPIGRQFLQPTRIYVQPILNLIKTVPVLGIVNITGGGFEDNLPRVIPSRFGAAISNGAWPRPKVFDLIQDSVNMKSREFARTFNLGIGMVVILKRGGVVRAKAALRKMRIPAWVIGKVTSRSGVAFQ